MGAEKFRRKEDRIPTRLDLSLPVDGPLGHFGASFLLYRGGQMKDAWIRPYEDGVGIEGQMGGLVLPAFIALAGSTSTSESLSTALQFSFPENEKT